MDPSSNAAPRREDTLSLEFNKKDSAMQLASHV